MIMLSVHLLGSVAGAYTQLGVENAAAGFSRLTKCPTLCFNLSLKERVTVYGLYGG